MKDPINPTAVLENAVRFVHRKFGDYVDREDLRQEGLVWWLAHPQRIQDLTEQGKNSWLFQAFVAPMEVYARRERAQALGFDPSDEQFYSAGMLSAILPHLHHGTRPTLDGPGGHVDPAEGGTWDVIVIDVTRALSALDPDDQALLDMRWGEENTVDGVASTMGWTYDEARRRSERAMRRLIDKLGGKRPQPCNKDCEH